MTALAREVRFVQNPALGAGLLWRFSCGYYQAHSTRECAPILLAYIVLPALLHRTTHDAVRSTREASGLRAAVAKFEDSKDPKQDVLLSLHGRVLRLRGLSTESLGIAIAKDLVSVSPSARVVPNSLTPAIAGISAEPRQLMRDAEKLGSWSAALTLHEIALVLKVRF